MTKPPPPVIERPRRSPLFMSDTSGNSSGQSPSNLNPLTNFQLAFEKKPQNENPHPNALTPRQPTVHFFVCDHGNAKVKAYSDQFIEVLVQNGIKVYPELYLTHQPGYQVRAASFNTTADFFFQIHSKTAGHGTVRLYLDGQPQRMTTNEAVTYIWAMWHLKCGALTKNEADSLSNERLNFLLQHFADIKKENVDIENVQKELREAISKGQSVKQCIEKLTTMSEILDHGKNKILETKLINPEFKNEPGAVLSRCPTVPIISGLSAPIREILLSIIDQSQKKVSVLISIAQNHLISEPDLLVEEDAGEVDIPDDQQPTTFNWGLMLESAGEHQTSLSSFGDNIGSQGLLAMAPHFLLDDL